MSYEEATPLDFGKRFVREHRTSLALDATDADRPFFQPSSGSISRGLSAKEQRSGFAEGPLTLTCAADGCGCKITCAPKTTPSGVTYQTA